MTHITNASKAGAEQRGYDHDEAGTLPIALAVSPVASRTTPGAASFDTVSVLSPPDDRESLAGDDTEEEGEGGDDVEQAGERSPSTPPKGRPKQKPPSPEVSPRPEPEGVPPAAAVRVHAPIQQPLPAGSR